MSTVVTPKSNVPNRRVNEPQAHRNDNAAPVDKINIFHNARWIGSCEAAWRILGLPLGEIKPPVTRLQVHLENQQRILIKPVGGKTKEQLQADKKHRRISLTEYFALNRQAKEAEDAGRPCPFDINGVAVDPREYGYQDFPKRFVWNKKLKTWTVRKKQVCVGRMYFMSPKSGEPFYLRLLLANRKSVTSFEDLRTVEVPVDDSDPQSPKQPRLFPTYQEACRALHLTDDDGEWHRAMQESAEFGSTGAAMRGLLVTLFMECHPADPLKLWKDHIAAYVVVLLSQSSSF